MKWSLVVLLLFVSCAEPPTPPDSITLEALSAWYDEHLPRGVDWKGWTWCEESLDVKGEAYGFQRLYVRKGTAEILTVIVGDGKAEPAFVYVGTDMSGPCS